jgi:hypothetical protein
VQQPEIRLATPSDRERIVRTVVAAFENEPAFRYFFPGLDEYAAWAPVLIGHLLDQRLAFETVWVVDGGSAVSMWTPPGLATVDLTSGVPDEALERLHHYDDVVGELLPSERHWYLGILATDPAHSGKRWGRLAMEQGLQQAQLDGRPAYLETTTDKNVAIYSASGWDVSGSVPFDTFTVRVMRHLPEPTIHPELVKNPPQ